MGRTKNSTGSSWTTGSSRYVEEMLGSIDGILLGRTTYEAFCRPLAESTQAEAAAMNALPKFVASTTLTRRPRGPTRPSSPVTCPEAVARMKQEPGRDLALLGSSIWPPRWPPTGSSTSTGSSSHPPSSAEGGDSSTACPNGSGCTLKETRVSASGVISQFYTTGAPVRTRTPIEGRPGGDRCPTQVPGPIDRWKIDRLRRLEEQWNSRSRLAPRRSIRST